MLTTITTQPREVNILRHRAVTVILITGRRSNHRRSGCAAAGEGFERCAPYLVGYRQQDSLERRDVISVLHPGLNTRTHGDEKTDQLTVTGSNALVQVCVLSVFFFNLVPGHVDVVAFARSRTHGAAVSLRQVRPERALIIAMHGEIQDAATQHIIQLPLETFRGQDCEQFSCQR